MRKIVALLFSLIVALCFIPAGQAENQRYISIRNTDNVWVPGNICALQFRLDNGGSGEGFHRLEITLRLKDKAGKVIGEGVMEVAHFGDSEASRSQNSFMESECHESLDKIEVIAANEDVNGTRVPLDLSIFDPQYYKPLPIDVADK